MHTRTSGGSSDTDVNELAVKPRGEPSGWIVVTTVTPVTNAPSARRNSARSKGCCAVWSSIGLVMTFSVDRLMRRFLCRRFGEKREQPLVDAIGIGDAHHVPLVRD